MEALQQPQQQADKEDDFIYPIFYQFPPYFT